MDLRSRRTTRSSSNENGEPGQKGIRKQSSVATRRLLAEKTNRAVVKVENPFVKTQLPHNSVVKRPEITGIERELSAADFTDDVHAYLLSRESAFQPPAKFCEASDVTPKMRSILIDWLIQVHSRFQLVPETLHLAIYIVDCAIANMKIDKGELQLVGVASMFAAAKFEEMYVPDLAEFELIADNAYSRRQIIRMEVNVLRACEFALSRPHSITILRWLARELNVSKKQYAIAKYLGEVALLDYSLAPYLPSQIAAISLFIAGRLSGCDTDVDEIMKMIVWSRGQLEVGARILSQATLRLHNQEKLIALMAKYSSIKQYGVSRFNEDDLAQLSQI